MKQPEKFSIRKSPRQTESALSQTVTADEAQALRALEAFLAPRLKAAAQEQLLETVELLEQRKIGLKTITQSIDTTNAGGRLIFTVFGAIAEFEREIIRERTRAGLDAARSRGRTGGRPRALSDKDLKVLSNMV